MISIQITGLDAMDKLAQAAFKGKEKLRVGLRKEVVFFGEAIVGTSREKYLSGRPGLNVMTGTLRSSINYEVSDFDKGFKLSVGTWVPYAVYHEQPEGPGVGIIPKRAFLAPALEDQTKPFLENVDKYLTDFLEQGLA